MEPVGSVQSRLAVAFRTYNHRPLRGHCIIPQNTTTCAALAAHCLYILLKEGKEER